jgi:adenylate kinase
VIYPGYIPVGNATLVVANVLTCNTHSQKNVVFVPQCVTLDMHATATTPVRHVPLAPTRVLLEMSSNATTAFRATQPLVKPVPTAKVSFSY